jgi:thioredoxin-dependent peroxiredoxin
LSDRQANVGAMSEQKRLSVGDPAPGFRLPDSTGKDVSLSDFRGRHVVVYFYPAASTPGCTTQACDFRDSLAELNDAGFTVLGISPDKPAKLAKFVADEGLTFPLLADEDRTVLTEWGAFGEKQNYGRTIMGVIRSTFVVDPEGTIAKAMYNVRATGHVAKLRREIGV